MKNINTSEFWNHKNKDDESKLIASPIYQYKINYVLNCIKRSKDILDLGVGNGTLEKEMVLRKFKIKMYGIDISQRSIKNISKLVKGNFKIANINKIPFSTLKFESIVALDILEHLSESEFNNVLKEIKKNMSRNSNLIISLPLNESYKDKLANRHLLEFSESEIDHLFNRFGLIINKKTTATAFNTKFIFKNILNKIFKFKKPNLIILICKKR